MSRRTRSSKWLRLRRERPDSSRRLPYPAVLSTSCGLVFSDLLRRSPPEFCGGKDLSPGCVVDIGPRNNLLEAAVALRTDPVIVEGTLLDAG
jgi:hypothetical protein